jgi:SAM-dependent methyltransferase
MPVGYFRALRILHRTFRHYPPGVRLHILVRFLTCPFTRTIDAVPRAARVLEIGAGHGVYSRLIVEERAAEAILVEPDLRKTFLPLHHPRIRVVAGFDDSIRGEFDAIVICDVIYRIDPAQRDALFQRVFERLAPGGVFVVKDVDPTNRMKGIWNRMQEALNDWIFHLTLGDIFESDTPAEIAARMTRAGFIELEATPVDRGYPHAHILYTARRPAMSSRA